MNEEPIGIKFLINSPEVLEQAMQVQNSLKGVDNAVAKSEKAFDDYVQSQLAINNAMREGVKLNEDQQRAFNSYSKTIAGLKAMMQEATDPTQIAVYKYQIEKATESLQRLIDSARNKTELIDTAKLEEAGRLLESIYDKTFSPDFASNAELEALSEQINKAGSEMEQLGAVIDFVEAKLEGMDKDSQTFTNLKADIETANEMLGRTVKIYDASGDSINEMKDSLLKFKEELSSETDIEKIKVLNKNIEELEARIKQLSNAGKDGFDEFGNKIKDTQEKTKTLQTELRAVVQEMARLKMEGKDNTEQYRILSDEATRLRASVATVNEEIRHSASTTNSLDTLIRATKGITAGYTLAKGASALFGKENEEVEKTIMKVTTAMSIMQSLQVIQAELKRKDSVATKTLIVLKQLYAKAVGNSTGAMKTFRLALLASGVGIFLVLLGELVANWDKVKRAIGLTNDELERNKAIGKKANELYGNQIAKLRMLVSTNKEVALTEEQKKEAVKNYNKEFGNVLGIAKDYNELEERIIKNAPKYIEYLQLKAQADASYMISLEKQKNLLEQIKALSTGDLKWYEKLQDFSDKMFEKGWNTLGVDIGETQRNISQSEILNIIGLPSEDQFNDALKGYSSVIQSNLQKFRKQQKEDESMFKASFDLQKKAGELANRLNIKSEDKDIDDRVNKAFQEKIKALDEIAKAEDNFNKSRLRGLEKSLIDIEQRYAKLKEQAVKAKLDAKELDRINTLEAKEKASVIYKNDTDNLVKQLEQEKELFKAYEQLKSQIGSEELIKRYDKEFKTAKDFKARLNAEINAITNTPDSEKFPEMEARLKVLQEMLQKYEKDTQQNDEQKYLKAYQAVLTFEEKKSAIEKQYLSDKEQLEKISDTSIREAKIKALAKQHNENLENLKTQSYDERRQLEENGEVLIGITREQLKNRIASLKEYLSEAKDSMDASQQQFIEKELKRAVAITGINDLATQENALLARKKQLLEIIAKNGEKGLSNVKEESAELENINGQLSQIAKEKMQGIADWAGVASDAFFTIAKNVEDTNPALAEQLEIMGELANMAMELGTAIVSGNPLAIASAGIKAIGSILSMNQRARESEKKAQAELKKYQDEIFASQLAYNKLLRDRLQDEATLNALYESRSTTLKKQINAYGNSLDDIKKNYNTVFERLLESNTLTDKRVKKPGGMFRKWRKTKVIEEYSTISELLGLERGTELTDDIIKNLERLNFEKPLTGDAKEAYEQLQKLKDEYGSIDKLKKDAETELKNVTTGTTADALANSIRQGLASGKKSFADFADDIEGFLRNAVIAGLSKDIIEPQIQQLQDELALMMEDGTLSESEMTRFQEMYMSIVNQAKEQMDVLNQAGINVGGTNQANSMKGAIKGMTEQQADLLAGQFGGLRLTQLETNQILKAGASNQLKQASKMIELQTQIELNTRSTATNTKATTDELQKLNNKINGQSEPLTILRSAGQWTP